MDVTYEDIVAAHTRIAPYIHRTPILTCTAIDKLVHAQLFFKCENIQKIGAFKIRGGTNAVLKLSDNEARHGVVTQSSGNHAQAIALAAKQRGIKAFIVMPHTSSPVKKAAVVGYGAEIIESGSSQQEREDVVNEVIARTGAHFIHPYDHVDVIAGQGTAAKELLEDVPQLDTILAPIGGGGLMSGTCLAARYLRPDIKILGAEPANADDAFRSVRDDKLYPQVIPNTIADGLLTALSERTFGIIRSHVSEILLAQEDTIKKAMRLMWERMKIVVEPSGAVPLAALLDNPTACKNLKVGIIISGGNVQFPY